MQPDAYAGHDGALSQRPGGAKPLSHHYYENDLLQLIELPYTGNAASMLVLLPRSQNGLTDLDK